MSAFPVDPVWINANQPGWHHFSMSRAALYRHYSALTRAAGLAATPAYVCTILVYAPDKRCSPNSASKCRRRGSVRPPTGFRPASVNDCGYAQCPAPMPLPIAIRLSRHINPADSQTNAGRSPPAHCAVAEITAPLQVPRISQNYHM